MLRRAAPHPQLAHNREHDQECSKGRPDAETRSEASSACLLLHRAAEGLLERGQPARVAPFPDQILREGWSTPEEIDRTLPLSPQTRRLAELIAQMRALSVLIAPAHESRPRGQQRLVNDLQPAVPGCPVVQWRLERGQQTRLDEPAEHFLRFAPLIRERGEELLPRARRSRSFGGHEVRKISRTIGTRTAPMVSSVSSACWARAPATPPISS